MVFVILDVMNFILFGEGLRVRVLLVKDIVRIFFVNLKYYYLDFMKLEKDFVYIEYVGESLKLELVGELEVG